MAKPEKVVTDRAAALANAIEEPLPQAWHKTIKYANNQVECDTRADYLRCAAAFEELASTI